MYQPQGNDYMNQAHTVAPAHVIPGRQRQSINWVTAGAYIIGALGVGVAIVCLLFVSSFKSVYANQMTQMRQALTAAQSTQSKDANNIANLSGQLSSAEAELNLLTPYSLTCSQYLTGPNGGPSTFYFPCRLKPGS
jgi:hypothetical protein